jgi:hypothetical protein
MPFNRANSFNLGVSHISSPFLLSIFSPLYQATRKRPNTHAVFLSSPRLLPAVALPKLAASPALAANTPAPATAVAPELQAELPTETATCSSSSPNTAYRRGLGVLRQQVHAAAVTARDAPKLKLRLRKKQLINPCKLNKQARIDHYHLPS